MTDDHLYFRWLIENDIIRVGSRAIIVNASVDRFLIEKNHGAREKYLNFIGGGVEIGETLESCLQREIKEETNAKIIRMDYLFFVENFVTYKGEITHGIGHYFKVELDREDVLPTTDGIDFLWFSSDDLVDVDLRPNVVRDHIVKGTYRSVRRLVSKGIIA